MPEKLIERVFFFKGKDNGSVPVVLDDYDRNASLWVFQMEMFFI